MKGGEIRRIQALTGDRSLTLVFPKIFAFELGIEKEDFLNCRVDRNRLIVERLDTEDRRWQVIHYFLEEKGKTWLGRTM